MQKKIWRLQEHFVAKPALNCNKDFRGVGTLSHMIALQHSYIVKGDQCLVPKGIFPDSLLQYDRLLENVKDLICDFLKLEEVEGN